MIPEPLTEEQKPGKNAIEYICEMKCDGEEGEQVKCRLVADEQCSKCTAWVCTAEETMHSLICARCADLFCPSCYAEHRRENKCQEAA